MIKEKYLVFLIVMLFFNGCKTKEQKIFKKQYYTSGQLKTYGWYINDSTPIDTLHTLYENGNLLAMDIFDSLGYYIKAIGYYENGKMNELINYKNGLAEGFRSHFYQNGNLKKKVFYFHDLSIGDAYFFDSSNDKITSYNFYDWHQHNLNLIKYDSVGNITKDIRQAIFIDSLKLYVDSLKENQSSINLLLIISNPPKCKSVIKVDYLNKSNSVIKSDSVINKSFYFKKENLPDSLTSINILGSQYDSIKNKTVFQTSKMNLK